MKNYNENGYIESCQLKSNNYFIETFLFISHEPNKINQLCFLRGNYYY
jgi:hypothetical protein